MNLTANPFLEDPELLTGFTIEAGESLAEVESQLLQLEESFDAAIVDNLFRAIHSVKGAAGFMQLHSICELAHGLEDLLSKVRSRDLTIDHAGVEVLLASADKLRDMVKEPVENASTDVSRFLQELSLWENSQASTCVSRETSTVAEDTLDVIESLEQICMQSDPSASATTDLNRCEPAQSNREAYLQLSAPVSVETLSTANLPHQNPKATDAVDSLPANNDHPSTVTKSSNSDATIRVSVAVLEELVNLAGEMVLSRNQLLRCVNDFRSKSLTNVATRIDQVTTAMQDVVMSARMQQVGTLFNRFPRLVRDLNAKLNKKCRMVIEGADVELDKTIIEALSDPLTHLIRNSLDHGVEAPSLRVAAGKSQEATLRLSAYHEAGKVHIEIADDGQGIRSEKVLSKAIERGLVTPHQAARMSEREIVNLIFMPGFSTAETVSAVSGRGVGMDVVRTNIERIGGTVDVNSTAGKGAIVHVTLPLTLAIIPSWVVQQDAFRFALPESSIVEFVRLTRKEFSERVDCIQGAKVLRWRDELLPLIRLTDCLSGLQEPEKRSCQPMGNATNIVVVESGKHLFGIIVQKVCDPEQIVVKPIGKHLRECGYLEGAAVLGDGNVAFILGLHGIAQRAQLSASRRLIEVATAPDAVEAQTALLFRTTKHRLAAVPRMVIQRIERINTFDVQEVTGRFILPIGDKQLPVIRLPWIDAVEREKNDVTAYLLIFNLYGQEIGLMVPDLVDICEIPTSVDARHSNQEGVAGTVLINDQVVEVLDLYEIADRVLDLSKKQASTKVGRGSDNAKAMTILLAEDTPFFRNQIQKFLVESGFHVLSANDGYEAWELLESHGSEINLVLTDIEMPRMNGYELARQIRQVPRFESLPIIAITSLHSDECLAKGHLAGIDDWKIKLDRDELIESISLQISSKKRVSVHY